MKQAKGEELTDMVVTVTDVNQKQTLVRTEDDEKFSFSFQEIIDRVDKLPLNYNDIPEFQENMFYLMTHDNIKIGFVCRFILNEMTQHCEKLVAVTFDVDSSKRTIRFKSNDFNTRNEQIDQISTILREHSNIEDLKGWRNEKYAVWCPEKKPYVLIERAMAGPMGILTYGVHINGYFFDSKTKEIRFWIPRRSATKPTWPYMLDNMVAGGIGFPYGIHETVIKESLEEANLPQDIINASISNAGVVSYLFYQGNSKVDKFNSQKSYIVGEIEYIYDMKLNEDTIPRPNDGEVDSFNVLSLQEVMTALQNAEFKPNCALVMVDFLIRHGFITTENEPNYLEIVNRIHRTLPFPTRN
ncbi:similar to Saccharomyces cerevisiae YJR142W Putative protein of unknown function [Maudiozyma barnettii]|uniref:Nudix hydrolase domain-containing protein n=1 Tax=Maudiozyma barnettii TaxID=61262 RepID=A0A8H2VJC8_9SACH|nr:hypothetical protein [Kazachstania barnettii]CAB4256491.1 similar to Saccharomyces cerevisiae YJR142W Putative protein of unknown function [Kazachstania barnettii]CAD1785094.1 similar to Saccharomyces cerevisiae YJR142W Putative protein of unknown function [Kazachstania barnettii]